MGQNQENQAKRNNEDSDKDDSNPFAMASDEKNEDLHHGLESPEMPRSFSLPGMASNMNEQRHQQMGLPTNSFEISQDNNDASQW